MGTIFRKQTTRALPPSAEIVTKGGKRLARWRHRGKSHSAELIGTEDAPRIRTEARTYSARYRDYTGKVVERSTDCRDRQTAEQMLGKWEREAEQIRAGILDPAQIETARAGAGILDVHLAAYE